jgi:hypothetical protein
MPAFTGTTNIIEIKTVANCASAGSNAKTINIISHWRRTATVLAMPKAAIDTAYQALIAVPIFAALNIRVTQSNNQIRSMNDANDPYTSFSHAVVGSITGDSMPTDQAAYLLLRTALRGRSYRGSKHFAPMSESDTTVASDDLFNAACLTRLATIATAFLTGFTPAAGEPWIPVILSRRPPAQYSVNPTTVVTNDVVSILVKKTVGSMLHRKVKSVY